MHGHAARRAAAALRAGYAGWAESRRRAAEDERTWQVAIRDPRIMAELSHAMGVRTVMISGDNRGAAQAIARQVVHRWQQPVRSSGMLVSSFATTIMHLSLKWKMHPGRGTQPFLRAEMAISRLNLTFTGWRRQGRIRLPSYSVLVETYR